jgi:membrane-associated phospholipid phosphatase
MEPLYEFGLEATHWLQANYPSLESFLEVVSNLGRFEFYLLILPLIYWCVNKRLGATLTYLLTLSTVVTVFIKHALHEPRPYWLDASLGLDVEDSYGIPSAHAQSSTVTYLLPAAWYRRRWLWALGVLLVLTMVFSRIYLGVHFVHDTIAGVLVGVLFLVGYFIWRRYAMRRFNNTILGQRLLAAVLVPAVLGILYIGVILLVGPPDDSVAWASFIPSAEMESLEDATAYFGLLFGLGIAFVFEGSRVRFLVDGPWWKRLLRYVLGMIVMVAIWRGLALFFEGIVPANSPWITMPLRFVRYFLLALWAGYYGPLTFVRLGLAPARPEPEISLNVTHSPVRS